MTKRIFAGIILVSLATMLACIGLVMGVMYDYLGDKVDDEMRDEAKLVETAIELNGIEYLEKIDGEDTQSRITLIADNGEVLFDSDANSDIMSNHLEREEVKEALEDGEGSQI